MSEHNGRVPYTFPLSVAQGKTERPRQQIDGDGRIKRVVLFFPTGTRTDLRLTPVAGGEPINEAEATDDSPAIPEHLIGSGTTYEFDVSIQVFEGQELGVNAENVSSSSDLDAFVAFSIDFDPPDVVVK